MKTTVRIVARPAIAAGFRLTGLPVLEAPDDDHAFAQLRELLADPSIGVVLVEERQLGRLPDDINRTIARRAMPMVVPFPGPAWEAQPELAESYIVALLRQVIGYRVRLR